MLINMIKAGNMQRCTNSSASPYLCTLYISKILVNIETLITFLTLESNNLNIHCHPSIKSNMGKHLQFFSILSLGWPVNDNRGRWKSSYYLYQLIACNFRSRLYLVDNPTQMTFLSMLLYKYNSFKYEHHSREIC